MKKIIYVFIILLSLIIMIDKVQADDEIGCKYKLEATDGASDTITFYFIKGQGLVNKFDLGSLKGKQIPNSPMAGMNSFTFAQNKKLYLDGVSAFTNVFDNTISSCPSQFSFFSFGKGNQLYNGNDEYVLFNYNYHNGEIVPNTGSIKFIEQNSRNNKNNNKNKNKNKNKNNNNNNNNINNNNNNNNNNTNVGSRVNCSEPYVFALNSYLDASTFKEYSVMIQYFMENNKKFAELKMKRGTTELNGTIMELHPEVNNVLMTDYFANTYGGLKLEIETFDKCDVSVNKLKAIKDEKGTETYLFIGVNGQAVENTLDRETENELETKEEYEENYNGNFKQVEVDINKDKMTCTQILGKVLTKVVRTGITIIQIIVAIIAIVKGMMTLIPAVVAKDADGLKKAGRTLATMGVILALVIIFKPLVRLIGNILGYDVTCII